MFTFGIFWPPPYFLFYFYFLLKQFDTQTAVESRAGRRPISQKIAFGAALVLIEWKRSCNPLRDDNNRRQVPPSRLITWHRAGWSVFDRRFQRATSAWLRTDGAVSKPEIVYAVEKWASDSRLYCLSAQVVFQDHTSDTPGPSQGKSWCSRRLPRSHCCHAAVTFRKEFREQCSISYPWRNPVNVDEREASFVWR